MTGCAFSVIFGRLASGRGSLSFSLRCGAAASVTGSNRETTLAHAKRRRWLMAILCSGWGPLSGWRFVNCSVAPRCRQAVRRDNSRMPQAITSVSIALARGPLSAADADLIAIPWFEEDGPAAIAGLDAATGGEIARALGSKEFRVKRYELF